MRTLQDAGGPLGCSGWPGPGLRVCLCQVELAHCPVLWWPGVSWDTAVVSTWSLVITHHQASVVTNIEYASDLGPGAANGESKELYNVQGQVTSHGVRWHIVKTYVDRLRFNMISANDCCIVRSDVTSWACLRVTTPDFFSISCF